MENKSEAGFSLVELMMVVVVVGIMATVAIPNFLSWLPNIHLKSAANDLYSNIQKAKLVAAKRNACAGVNFSTVVFPATGGDYTVFVDDGGTPGSGGNRCNGVKDGDEIEVFSNDIGNGLSLSSANIGGASFFCFTPTSVTCGSQFGDIQLRNNQSRWYRVTVRAAGGVEIEMSGDGINWSN